MYSIPSGRQPHAPTVWAPGSACLSRRESSKRTAGASGSRANPDGEAPSTSPCRRRREAEQHLERGARTRFRRQAATAASFLVLDRQHLVVESRTDRGLIERRLQSELHLEPR